MNSKKIQEKGAERREQGCQTDDKAFDDHEEHYHGGTLCSRKLNDIQEKLDKMLSFLPEIQALKTRVSELEKEKDALELTQAELHELKNNATSTAAMRTSTTKKLARLDELERRVIKQECFNRRNNLKFFGIKDDGYESPEETERTLRKFLQNEMKISKEVLEEIYFERVHRMRIPTRPSEEQNQHPRPIIAKISFFQDKEYIKSCIKNLPKGKKFGVVDDFPKEVDEIREKLYPVLKKVKKEKKVAFFIEEKLIIETAVYHGPETEQFPLYGRIMDNS